MRKMKFYMMIKSIKMKTYKSTKNKNKKQRKYYLLKQLYQT